jgi:hypothetical protein
VKPISSLSLAASMPQDPCPACPIRAHCKRARVACAGWRIWASKGRVDTELLQIGLQPLDYNNQQGCRYT